LQRDRTIFEKFQRPKEDSESNDTNYSFIFWTVVVIAILGSFIVITAILAVLSKRKIEESKTISKTYSSSPQRLQALT
jgi:hypothetical protein